MNQGLKENTPISEGSFICIYKNASNKVSIQEVINASFNETKSSTYIQGWSIKHERPTTLLVERVM